ncbi:MAG: hypothetical protein QM813_06180 [Verrucomicrobiota bacterium]
MLYHHLWTVNPDGSNLMVYFGNQFPGLVMIDARPIPGSDLVVASFSPGHGAAEHMGPITLVDPRRGPDDMSAARKISPRPFRDPYALSEQLFFVADKTGLHLLSDKEEVETFFRPEPGARWECHEPRPLRARQREAVVSGKVDPREPSGRLVLSDVYHGRNMEGIKPGEIKKLLVLEQLPRPVNFSNGQEPLTLGGSFMLERVLGTVPVEADGSAYMELPAMRSLFFVALDDKDLSVKRMQSAVTVQPGETTSCVGCHEQRTRAPAHPGQHHAGGPAPGPEQARELRRFSGGARLPARHPADPRSPLRRLPQRRPARRRHRPLRRPHPLLHAIVRHDVLAGPGLRRPQRRRQPPAALGRLVGQPAAEVPRRDAPGRPPLRARAPHGLALDRVGRHVPRHLRRVGDRRADREIPGGGDREAAAHRAIRPRSPPTATSSPRRSIINSASAAPPSRCCTTRTTSS